MWDPKKNFNSKKSNSKKKNRNRQRSVNQISTLNQEQRPILSPSRVFGGRKRTNDRDQMPSAGQPSSCGHAFGQSLRGHGWRWTYFLRKSGDRINRIPNRCARHRCVLLTSMRQLGAAASGADRTRGSHRPRGPKASADSRECARKSHRRNLTHRR